MFINVMLCVFVTVHVLVNLFEFEEHTHWNTHEAKQIMTNVNHAQSASTMSYAANHLQVKRQLVADKPKTQLEGLSIYFSYDNIFITVLQSYYEL